MYCNWFVILPGRFSGGVNGGWTTPLTGSMRGSSRGGGSFTSRLAKGSLAPPAAATDPSEGLAGVALFEL